MRQADVAGEPTWGASWICTSILGETEDTNGCFEFNICYFLPAGVTYGTFAVHSAVPSEYFLFFLQFFLQFQYGLFMKWNKNIKSLP